MKDGFNKIIKIIAISALVFFSFIGVFGFWAYLIDKAPDPRLLSQCVRMHIEVDDKNANIICDEYARGGK